MKKLLGLSILGVCYAMSAQATAAVHHQAARSLKLKANPGYATLTVPSTDLSALAGKAASQDLTLTNYSNASLTIDSITPSSGTTQGTFNIDLASSTCQTSGQGQTLAPMSSCFFRIDYVAPSKLPNAPYVDNQNYTVNYTIGSTSSSTSIRLTAHVDYGNVLASSSTSTPITQSFDVKLAPATTAAQPLATNVGLTFPATLQTLPAGFIYEGGTFPGTNGTCTSSTITVPCDVMLQYSGSSPSPLSVSLSFENGNNVPFQKTVFVPAVQNVAVNIPDNIVMNPVASATTVVGETSFIISPTTNTPVTLSSSPITNAVVSDPMISLDTSNTTCDVSGSKPLIGPCRIALFRNGTPIQPEPQTFTLNYTAGTNTVSQYFTVTVNKPTSAYTPMWVPQPGFTAQPGHTDTMTFTLLNASGSAVGVTGIITKVADFSNIQTTCGASLAPNATCSLTATYTLGTAANDIYAESTELPVSYTDTSGTADPVNLPLNATPLLYGSAQVTYLDSSTPTASNSVPLTKLYAEPGNASYLSVQLSNAGGKIISPSTIVLPTGFTDITSQPAPHPVPFQNACPDDGKTPVPTLNCNLYLQYVPTSFGTDQTFPISINFPGVPLTLNVQTSTNLLYVLTDQGLLALNPEDGAVINVHTDSIQGSASPVSFFLDPTAGPNYLLSYVTSSFLTSTFCGETNSSGLDLDKCTFSGSCTAAWSAIPAVMTVDPLTGQCHYSSNVQQIGQYAPPDHVIQTIFQNSVSNQGAYFASPIWADVAEGGGTASNVTSLLDQQGQGAAQITTYPGVVAIGPYGALVDELSGTANPIDPYNGAVYFYCGIQNLWWGRENCAPQNLFFATIGDAPINMNANQVTNQVFITTATVNLAPISGVTSEPLEVGTVTPVQPAVLHSVAFTQYMLGTSDRPFQCIDHAVADKTGLLFYTSGFLCTGGANSGFSNTSKTAMPGSNIPDYEAHVFFVPLSSASGSTNQLPDANYFDLTKATNPAGGSALGVKSVRDMKLIQDGTIG